MPRIKPAELAQPAVIAAAAVVVSLIYVGRSYAAATDVLAPSRPEVTQDGSRKVYPLPPELSEGFEMTREEAQEVQFFVWQNYVRITYAGHHFYVSHLSPVGHVTFPTEETWNETAPAWAEGKWQFLWDATREWCEESGLSCTSETAGIVDFVGNLF